VHLRGLYVGFVQVYIDGYGSVAHVTPIMLRSMLGGASANSTAMAGVAGALSHEEQHHEVYLNMISFIANIPVTELAIPVENDDEDADDPIPAPVVFGTAMHAQQPAVANAQVPAVRPHTKSAALIHTENMIWHLLTTALADADASDNLDGSTFGSHLFRTIPSTVVSLSQVLDMLCRADTALLFHALIYHIATLVAFQHYVRLVVLRTGQFAPQRTMNIQTSYQNTLLIGLCQAPLTAQQREYMKTFVYAAAPTVTVALRL